LPSSVCHWFNFLHCHSVSLAGFFGFQYWLQFTGSVIGPATGLLQSLGQLSGHFHRRLVRLATNNQLAGSVRLSVRWSVINCLGFHRFFVWVVIVQSWSLSGSIWAVCPLSFAWAWPGLGPGSSLVWFNNWASSVSSSGSQLPVRPVIGSVSFHYWVARSTGFIRWAFIFTVCLSLGPSLSSISLGLVIWFSSGSISIGCLSVHISTFRRHWVTGSGFTTVGFLGWVIVWSLGPAGFGSSIGLGWSVRLAWVTSSGSLGWVIGLGPPVCLLSHSFHCPSIIIISMANTINGPSLAQLAVIFWVINNINNWVRLVIVRQLARHY